MVEFKLVLYMIVIAVVAILGFFIFSQYVSPGETTKWLLGGHAEEDILDTIKNVKYGEAQKEKAYDLSGFLVMPLSDLVVTNYSVLFNVPLENGVHEEAFEKYISTPYYCLCNNMSQKNGEFSCPGSGSTCPQTMAGVVYRIVYNPNEGKSCFNSDGSGKGCVAFIYPLKEPWDGLSPDNAKLTDPSKICQAIYDCLSMNLGPGEECTLKFRRPDLSDSYQDFLVENETTLDVSKIVDTIKNCPAYNVTKNMSDGSVYQVCTWNPKNKEKPFTSYNVYNDISGSAFEELKRDDFGSSTQDVSFDITTVNFDMLKYDINLYCHGGDCIDLWISLVYKDGSTSGQYFITGGPEMFDCYHVTNSPEHFSGVLTDREGKPISGKDVKKVQVHIQGGSFSQFSDCSSDSISIKLYRSTQVPLGILYPYCDYDYKGNNTLFYYRYPGWEQPFSTEYPGYGRVKFVMKNFNVTDCSFNINMCTQAKASEEYDDTGMRIFQFFRSFDPSDQPYKEGDFLSHTLNYSCYGPYEIELDGNYTGTEIFSAAATAFEEWKSFAAPSLINGSVYAWAAANVSGGSANWNYFVKNPSNSLGKKICFRGVQDSSGNLVAQNIFFIDDNCDLTRLTDEISSDKLKFYVTFTGNATQPYLINVHAICE